MLPVTVTDAQGTKVTVTDIEGKPQVVKAATLSRVDNILFRRNSVSGAIEAVPWKGGSDGAGIALQTIGLHRPSLDDVFLTKTGRSLRES